MARISITKFKEATKGSRGIITLIAQKLGKSRQAVYDFMEKYPDMKILVEEAAEKPVDMAENILHKKLKEDDMDAVKLVLLNHKRGRARGYGIKQELEHSGTLSLPTKIIEEVPDDGRGKVQADKKTKDSP